MTARKRPPVTGEVWTTRNGVRARVLWSDARTVVYELLNGPSAGERRLAAMGYWQSAENRFCPPVQS